MCVCVCRYLLESSHGSGLLLQFTEQFVFAPALWARADTNVSQFFMHPKIYPLTIKIFLWLLIKFILA